MPETQSDGCVTVRRRRRRSSIMGDQASARDAAQADYDTGGELMRIILQQARHPLIARPDERSQTSRH